MESLTGLNESAEIEIKSQENVGRIKIGKAESDKLLILVQQAQSASKGFLALSKSDIVNFLIREHKSELSPKQMQGLRALFYDPIKHMNWITYALKIALSSGDMAAVSNLQDEIKGIELSVITHAKGESSEVATEAPAPSESRPKRRRKKIDPPPSESESPLGLSDMTVVPGKI